MKKLLNNKGFTLIECIVAMAVLAVMTLGLLMILNVTVRQRNANMKIENDVDSQVEKIVQEDGTTVDSLGGGDIDFGDGVIINGGQMVYYDDPNADVQIGALQYDVGSSPSTGNPSNPGNPGGPAKDPDELLGQAYNYEYFKVYGAADVNGQIHINESKTGTDTYAVTWAVNFNTNSGSQERSVKIVLPEGSYDIDCTNYTNCEIADMAYSTVRIQPGILTGNEWSKSFTSKYENLASPLTTTVNITFKIDKDDYYYDNLSNYITGSGNSNDVSVDINKY